MQSSQGQSVNLVIGSLSLAMTIGFVGYNSFRRVGSDEFILALANHSVALGRTVYANFDDSLVGQQDCRREYLSRPGRR